VHGAAGADTTLVRLSQVTSLEVSTGKRRSRHAVRNMVIGAALGGGLGWVIGSGMTSGGCQKGDPCWDNICFLCWAVEVTPVPPVRDRATAGTVIGGLTGGAFALLLSRKSTDAWRPVSVPPRRMAVTMSPRGGGVAIAF
jgi:hypothetical protein